MGDREELGDLVSRLGLWLDEKRFDEARDVLAEDVSASTASGSVSGLDAVVRQARRAHPENVRTQHFITNPLFKVNGDHAAIDANLLVVFAEESRQRFLGERYRLEATRTAEGWRISRVGVDLVWDATRVEQLTGL
ncbi:nuclear transport factor 2 family protein [Actinomadura barringtoniae]|uniref:Nuclear transport factor 2 family protein n=1 Tax=Actinomadura barringtoniae TaxID=1427535 RepID=A0A939T8V4_9ACTN|nr:nuclear transport factor 2 family protein [Actinomadura barringtoniae]MBO2453579.1 nuclear transport factor 2 family protein [Actinomadura barringtoniae]